MNAASYQQISTSIIKKLISQHCDDQFAMVAGVHRCSPTNHLSNDRDVGDVESSGDTALCVVPALCLKLSATPERFRTGGRSTRSTRSGSGDCRGPSALPRLWLTRQTGGRWRATRAGFENAWVRGRGNLLQLGGSVAVLHSHSAFASECGPRSCHPASLPIVWGRKKVAAGKESQEDLVRRRPDAGSER